jgi:glycine hydroxymethyltransferase
MAAKAIAFKEALAPDFARYAERIVENSQALAQGCIEQGMKVLTNGTDNHLLLVDVAKSYGLTGRQAESALREAGVTLNRNSLPQDPNGPWYTSGLRLGTPATTTLGMGPREMAEIASVVKLVLSNTKPGTTPQGTPSPAKYVTEPAAQSSARARVSELLKGFPLYPELGDI